MPLPILAGAVGALGNIAGGVAGSLMNQNQAGIDRDDRRYYAENAHQVEVRDLKAAGLNPVLSAMGGSGAKFQGSSGSNVGDSVSAGVSSSAKMMSDMPGMLANLAIADATRKKLDQEALLAEANRINVHADTTNKLLQSDKSEKEKGWWSYNAETGAKLLGAELSHRLASVEATSASAKSYEAGAEASRAGAELSRAQAKNLKSGMGFKNPLVHDIANAGVRFMDWIQSLMNGGNAPPVGNHSAK